MREFFVGIDSDGCAFDTMEVKHKECFIPAFINHFGLAAASRITREVAEFVNLYSINRGINRFPGYLKVLDLLESHPEIVRRGVLIPRMKGLRVEREGNHAREPLAEDRGGADRRCRPRPGVALERGREPPDPRDRKARAPVPSRPRVARLPAGSSRRDGRLGHAHRGPSP